MKFVIGKCKILRGTKLGELNSLVTIEGNDKNNNVIMTIMGKREIALKLTMSQLNKMQIGMAKFMGENTRSRRLKYFGNKNV